MSKLVVLKLDGDLDVGVRVTLEIGEEGLRPSTEISGQLPPNPDMVTAIEQWRSTYRSLEKFARIKAKKIIYDGSITQRRSDCHNKALELRSRLNNWLLSESFRPVREKWLKQLMASYSVRVLIRTRSEPLLKLPWHLWDLVEDYPKAEVALSDPESEQPPSWKMLTYRNSIRILAILGNSDGIDVQKDRQLLENLSDCATTFLVEPQLQDINDQLWDQNWDILFFAGHSKTEGDIGRIYINQTDSLTIAELRYGLRKAVAGGLHLAIFNSCDGLGLARELADLHIPQVIVMREPVPDLVAQEFLQHFLKSFASGKSLYLAVRQARERLQGREDKFPCATWLPVICQNAAMEPPTWQKLGNKVSQNHSIMPIWCRLRTVFLASVVTTALLMGVRHQGLLQPLEILAFDHLLLLRPQEQQEQRLLIVTITEEDFQAPEQKQRIGSLSDLALARLLEKLGQFKPRAIGLDIYRADAVDRNQADLAARMHSNDGFFAICKVRDLEANNPGISPPPEVPTERLGFSDVVKDSDNILRRHLLAMEPDPTSPCTTPYALSAQLAFHYLKAEGISAKYTQTGDLQVGNVVFQRSPAPRSGEQKNFVLEYLQARRGGYQQVDTWGYQILLNYRSYRSLLEIAPKVTLTEVLTGQINPNIVKDRIVLIGVTATSAGDFISTPYSREMPGVIVQAQMVSQILSAVKDGRPLLSVWPFWGEALWVWGWSVVGGFLVWRWRSRLHLVMVGGAAQGVLYVICLGMLIQGSWIPLVPSALALIVTSGSVMLYPAFPKSSNSKIRQQI